MIECIIPTVKIAGVAPDIDLHFAWQAWHLQHWAGSGDALGSRLAPLSPRHFAWHAWHGDSDLPFFWTNCFLLGVVSVSPVSPVSLAAKGSGVVAVFVWCLCFFGLCFLVALVWLFWCYLLPSLPACLSSFTDWCLVHKQESREQKKVTVTFLLRGRRGTW